MIKVPDVTLLYVLVAFTIAYAILRKFLFLPLGAILEERANEEATAARVHAESLERLKAEVARAEAELSRARVEALKVREALRGEGHAHLEKKLAQARAGATEVLERAN